MKTQEQIERANGYYKQAVELGNKIYALCGELFNDNDLVAYTVEVSRWDTHATLRVFAMIGYGNRVSNSLRELAGNFSETISFTDFTPDDEKAQFVDKVAESAKPFARRAANVREIIEQENTMNV